MSKISINHRLSANGVSGAIYVKHTHGVGTVPFVRSTNVVLVKGMFDSKTGLVHADVSDRAELQKKIDFTHALFVTAVTNLLGKNIQPTKPAMEKAYAAAQEDARKWETERLPRVRALQARELERAREALVRAQEHLNECRKRLEELEIARGVYKGKLFANYFKRFKLETKGTLSERSHDLIESSTRNAIEFRPGLRIDQIDKQFLKDLQDHLLAKGRLNLSIRDVITKVRKVLFHFEEEFPTACASARRHTLLPKSKNENLIYLTPEELAALETLPLVKERERKVRDLFCFMAATGLRYSDAIRVTKNHVIQIVRRFEGKRKTVKELHITTLKRTKLVKIPLSATAIDLLKRNDYSWPAYLSASFNRDIKLICAKIPELNYEMEITTWSGANKTIDSFPKHTLIAAHAARRTFVNLCLVNDVSLASIRAWVGHSDLETTLGSYTDADAVAFDQMAKMKVVA